MFRDLYSRLAYICCARASQENRIFIHTDCKRNATTQTHVSLSFTPTLFNYNSILQIQGVRTEKLVY